MARDWPHLTELPGGLRPRWMSEAHWRDVRDCAERVRALTGAGAWIDRRLKQLCFGYRRHSGRLALIGGCDFGLFKGGDFAAPCRFQSRSMDGVCAEDIVHLVRLARVSPAQKDRWRREIDERQRRDDDEANNRLLEEMKPEFHARIRHGRERRGMHSKYRPSVVVNGLKGSAA